MKLLLTLNETADYVSLSISKINRLESENRFAKRIVIDGNVRFRVKDLDEWAAKLASGEIPASQKKRGRPRLAVNSII